jgi:hypothetical protein
MPKHKQSEPVIVRVNCWYCGKVCREELHYPEDHFVYPGQVKITGLEGIRLLSGDYAHQSCQDQVKPGSAYRKAKASYNAWMNRNNKKVMKYLNDPRIKVSITYFGDNNNGN